jgi:hypothetical protein
VVTYRDVNAVPLSFGSTSIDKSVVRPNGTQCGFDRWHGACGFGSRLALMSLERLSRCRLGGAARN